MADMFQSKDNHGNIPQNPVGGAVDVGSAEVMLICWFCAHSSYSVLEIFSKLHYIIYMINNNYIAVMNEWMNAQKFISDMFKLVKKTNNK